MLITFIITVLWILFCLIINPYVTKDDRTRRKNRKRGSRKAANYYQNNDLNNITTTQNENRWRQLKEQLLPNRGCKCEYCGSTYNLNVHHKIPIKEGGTNIDTNLIILCQECHERIHHFKFKESYSQTPDNYGFEQTNKNNTKAKINAAIEYGYYLKIRYASGAYKNNEITTRTIKPLNVLYAFEITDNEYIANSEFDKRHDILFLKAFCYLRNAERLFRIDKIEVLEIIEGKQ